MNALKKARYPPNSGRKPSISTRKNLIGETTIMPNTFNTDNPITNQILVDITNYGVLIDASDRQFNTPETQAELKRYTSHLDANNILHPVYTYPGTITNRITSRDPNIIGMSKPLRSIVVPRPGCILIDADYHQADIGGVAWVSGDPAMQRAYAGGLDFHQITASRIFNVPAEAVTADQRRKAKSVSLGILYGRTAYGVAAELNTTTEEAQDMIDAFFAEYEVLNKFKDNIVSTAFYSPDECVSTFFGTNIPVTGIHSLDGQERKAAYRRCLNYAVQGTTSDVFLRALISLNTELEQYNAHILVLAYDEFLIEAPMESAQEVADSVKRIMVEAAQPIPMSVDVQMGCSWQEVH